MIKEYVGINGAIVTVNEILETYDIKDIKLEDLQEKYVNMYEEKDEEISELKSKVEELESDNEYLIEELEELKKEYKEEIQYKDDSISYLRTHQETAVGSFFNSVIIIVEFIIFLTIIAWIYTKIKEFILSKIKRK